MANGGNRFEPENDPALMEGLGGVDPDALGGAVGERLRETEQATFVERIPDAGGSTAVLERPISIAPHPLEITSVVLVPEANVPADPNNYAQFGLYRRRGVTGDAFVERITAKPAAKEPVAAQQTRGNTDFDAMRAFQPFPLALGRALIEDPEDDPGVFIVTDASTRRPTRLNGETLSFEVKKKGTGVDLPAMRLVIAYRRVR